MPENIHKELVAPNDTKYLAKIREIVRDASAQCGFDDRDVGRIVLAVDEAVANIMEHAYEDSPETGGEIWVTIDADEANIQIVVADTGKQFDPQQIKVPDIKEHVSKGKKKGLGIFLMRQIMDEVKYTFVQGLRNELRMTKYLPNRGGDQ